MRAFVSLVLPVLVAAAACGSSGSSNPDATTTPDAGAPDATDLSAALFDPAHVVEVDIQMAPADWDTLRHQANVPLQLLGPGCQDGPRTSNFTYFMASATVDGVVLAEVGVRKKGFLGSLNIGKPSLKVKFDEFVPGQEAHGVEILTLNNNMQDSSQIKQCLAYAQFAAAGVPAPRCNFAHVVVNGEDLGVFSNIERVSPRFLRRHFADETGNLYEGQLSDFRAGWTATYEKKTNELDPDRSGLDALVTALEAPDGQLVAAVEPLVDLDAFLTFWAMEHVVGHWDGLTSNLNNHFAYHDPTSGQFHFIPWGADLTFVNVDPFTPEPRPDAVSAVSTLARRLYEQPEIQAQYVTRMQELLAQWDEAALVAEIDRMEALVAPIDDVDGFMGPAVERVRTYVNGRQALIESDLTGGAPAWTTAPRMNPCVVPTGTASGAFTTTYGTLDDMNPFGTGSGTTTYDIDGMMETAPMGTVGAAAGFDDSTGLGRRQGIQIVAAFPSGRLLVFIFYVAVDQYAAADLPLDWQSAFGAIVDASGANPQIIGLIDGGTLHLDMAGASDGGTVSGTFSGNVLSFLN